MIEIYIIPPISIEMVAGFSRYSRILSGVAPFFTTEIIYQVSNFKNAAITFVSSLLRERSWSELFQLKFVLD